MLRLRRLTLISFLYFISIPLSNLSQIAYWSVVIFGPLLFFTKKRSRISLQQKRYLLSYLILIILILFTGLLSLNVIWPLKRVVFLVSILATSVLLINNIYSIYDAIDVLKGIVLMTILYSVFLFLFASDGSFIFVFNEGLWFGKNDSSPIILVGLFSSMLLYIFETKNTKYLLSMFYHLVIILMTTSIKVIIPAILVMPVFYIHAYKICDRKVVLNLVFIFSIVSSIYLIPKTGLINSPEYLRTTARINSFVNSIMKFDFSMTTSVVSERYSLMQSGLEIFYNNVLFGIGLENTRIRLGMYTHNSFVELLAGGGVFSLIFFISALFNLFISIKNLRNRNLKNIMLMMFFIVVFIGNGQRIYDNQFLMIFCFLLSIISVYYNIFIRGQDGENFNSLA